MTSIQKNLTSILAELKPTGVKLVAVSKYHPIEALKEAYDVGQRCFGESHVQELEQKHAAMPDDVEWHFIGHLQTNKVKYITPYISLIHAVDTLKLLREIDKQAAKVGRVINCLLQVHVAKETTKFGFLPEELMLLMKNEECKDMHHVRICGLMCMATNTDNCELIRSEFRQVKQLYDEIKAQYFADNNDFSKLSMGMSEDYNIAIEEGSSMVRIGSMIFGERVYT